MLKRIERGLRPAFAYLRQCSANSQRQAIYAFAALAGFEIIQEFLDLGDATGASFAVAPGFAALLRLIELNGIRTIIVDTPSSLAGDAITQEIGYLALQERGIEVIAADSPDTFVRASPVNVAVRQVIEKAREIDRSVGAALARGIDKRRLTRTGAPWRKTYAEMEPHATSMAKRLYLNSEKTGKRMTLREISRELAASGHLTKDGKQFHPEAIRRMLKGQWPKAAAK